MRCGPMVLVQFGEVHPRVLRALELKAPAVAFEVFLEVIPLPRAARQKRSLLELSPFQPVSRDFAFLVDEDVPAEKVVRAARGADKALIAEVALFDVYRGKGVRSEEHTSELQSLMRIAYAVFCLKKKKK